MRTAGSYIREQVVRGAGASKGPRVSSFDSSCEVNPWSVTHLLVYGAREKGARHRCLSGGELFPCLSSNSRRVPQLACEAPRILDPERYLYHVRRRPYQTERQVTS